MVYTIIMYIKPLKVQLQLDIYVPPALTLKNLAFGNNVHACVSCNSYNNCVKQSRYRPGVAQRVPES